MIKKIILIMISLAMISAFAGCQLAVEGEEDAEPNTDALCGMFVTFEYLNSDGDFIDDIDWNAVMSGGRASINDREAGRIYAVLEDNGRTKDYVFKGIDGLRLFGVFVPGDGESEGYNTACIDTPLLDCKTAYNTTDEGTEISLEATLYVCPEVYSSSMELVCYCNPVYQTPDGQVYMTAGSGLGADLGSGASMSSTLSGAAEKTVNGEKESRAAAVKLTVTAIDYIEKYILKELDGQDRIVSTLEITKDNVPKEIALNEDTEYAILEKHCAGADGNPYVERSILDMGSAYLEVRFINEEGFAQGHGVTINTESPKA